MHLPIRVVGRSSPVEVPFRLFTSFKFAVHVPMRGVVEFVADLSGGNALTARVLQVEQVGGLFLTGSTIHHVATKQAVAILSAVLTRLGLVEVDGERRAIHGSDALTWIGIAHERETETQKACEFALADLMPVWRDRTEPAPRVHVAADILDSYYQQVQDEVLGEWEDKARREADLYLTSQIVKSASEVAP